MRISDWGSDVCSPDLIFLGRRDRRPGFDPTSGQSVAHFLHDYARLHFMDEPGDCIRLRLYGPVGTLCGMRVSGMVPRGEAVCRAGQASAVETRSFSSPSDRKSTRLNSSHYCAARMPSSA